VSRDLPSSPPPSLPRSSAWPRCPAYDRVFADTGWRARRCGRGARRWCSPVALRVAAGAVAQRPVWPRRSGCRGSPTCCTCPPVRRARRRAAARRAHLLAGARRAGRDARPAPVAAGLVLIVTVGGGWCPRHPRARGPLAPRGSGWSRRGAVGRAAGDPRPRPDLLADRRAVPGVAGSWCCCSVTARRPWPAGRRPPRPAAAPGSGLAVGALAIVVAAVAPGVLPGYGSDAWVDIGGGTDPRGYQPIVDVSERLRLPEERDVLRCAAAAQLPAPGRARHLRRFTWRLGPPTGSYRPDPVVAVLAPGTAPPEAARGQHRAGLRRRRGARAREHLRPRPLPARRGARPDPRRDGVVDRGRVPGHLGHRRRRARGRAPRSGSARRRPTGSRRRARPDLRRAAARSSSTTATLAPGPQLPRDYPAWASRPRRSTRPAGAETAVERALACRTGSSADGGFTYDLDVPALRGDEALERLRARGQGRLLRVLRHRRWR
jgi:hypothetical protein